MELQQDLCGKGGSESSDEAALILHRYKVNLRGKEFTFHKNEQENIWNDIVNSMKVTVVSSTELIENFLLEYIGNETKRHCKGCAKMWDDHLLLENYQEFTGKRVTLVDLYDFLWGNGKVPVLLEISSASEYENILQALSLTNYHRKVIILNKSKEDLPLYVAGAIRVFNSLCDLDRADQLSVLKQHVSLQGRCSVVLESIIDENMFEFISSSDVIRILLNKFNIGGDLEPLPAYFLKRSFSNVFIEARALNELKDEIFLIQEDTDKHFEMLSTENSNTRRLEQFGHDDYVNPNCRIIITRENVTLQAFKSTKKVIHHLKIHDDKYLEWQASTDSLYKIRDFKVELEDLWNSDINKLFCSPVNIISAPAGMGKSVFLDYVAQQAPSDKWVLKLNLNEHQEYLQSHDCRSRFTKGLTHLKYFAKFLFRRFSCDDGLTNAVFQKFASNKEDLIVLIDGLDNIIVSYKDEVINLIDSLQHVSRVWLTTRPQTQSFLEEEFDAFTVTIQPLPLTDRKELLFKCFNDKSLNFSLEFVEKCFTVAQNNFEVMNAELLGTPLLYVLLSEVFTEEADFKKEFDFIYLVQKGADKLIHRICCNLVVSEFISTDQLSLLSLKLFFPQIKEFIDTKIHQTLCLTEIKTHNTILEYLAAQWLLVNIKNQSKEFIRVIEKNRLNHSFTIFDALLPRDTEVNMDFNYNTLLHDAVLQRNADIISTLTWDEKCSYIHHQNADGNTPLHLAILDPKMEEKLITTLISKTIKLNVQNNDGNTYIHLALSKCKPKIAKLLLRKGVDPNIKNNEDKTALHLAAHNGYCDIIMKILPSITNINEQDLRGRTALFYAALRNKIDTLELLISKGADIKLQDATGETVLHRAAYVGHNRIVAELISNGANTEKRDDSGCTPLFCATFGNQPDTVKLLIAHGAEINTECNYKEIPLHNAAYGGYSDIVTELLANGINVNKEDSEGNAPLFHAARAGQINTLKLLILHGASINHDNKDGETALHRAASYGYDEIVAELVSKGADINKQTHFGFTPLHLALMENQLDTVKLLICNGACIHVDSKDVQVTKLLQKYLEDNPL